MKQIIFNCPHCQQHIEADAGYAGNPLDCPTCGKAFVVPTVAGKRMSALAVFFEVCVFCGIILIAGVIVYFKQIQPRAEEAAAQERLQRDLREINPSAFESPWETRDRLRTEAEAAQRKACSNYVGFSRIMDAYVDTRADAVSNWTGHATIDFVNRTGGVERTNLLFYCWEFEHHAECAIDEGKMERIQFEARMAAIRAEQ